MYKHYQLNAVNVQVLVESDSDVERRVRREAPDYRSNSLEKESFDNGSVDALSAIVDVFSPRVVSVSGPDAMEGVEETASTSTNKRRRV
jgi:hypothetical protein